MKIYTFTPYGSSSREAGLIYLLSSYLKNFYPSIVQLRCNGVCGVCGKDIENGWSRTIHSCFSCMADQKRMARWAGLKEMDLSLFMRPEDLDDVRKWIMTVPDKALASAVYQGVRIQDLYEESFHNRFGISIDYENRQHVAYQRKLAFASAQILQAVKVFNQSMRPDLMLVAGGQEFLTRTMIDVSVAQDKQVVVFALDLSGRCVHIQRANDGKVMSSDLILEDICGMRSDSKTWSEELVDMLEQIVSFLGIAEGQLDLPIAQ